MDTRTSAVASQAAESSQARGAAFDQLRYDLAQVPAVEGVDCRAAVLALSAALAMVLVLVKVWLLPFPVETTGEFVRWCLRLAIVAAPDLLFVALLAAACCGISYAMRNRGYASRAWRIALDLLFAACAVYAVAAVPIYEMMMVPLTVPLLSFAGGPGMMASSITSFVHPLVWLAALAAPGAVVYAGRRGADEPLVARLASTRWYWGAAVVLVAATGALLCHLYVMSAWTDPNRWERRIAQSPHGVLVMSAAGQWMSAEPLALGYDPQDTDVSDFAPAAPPAPAALSGPRPQNVIVLVLESVCTEYLGLYGSPHATTPELERLAAERGVVYDNFYIQSPSSCKSIVTLTAGVYPRVDWKLIVRDSPQFQVPTVAEVLSKQGYRSCFAHSGYWSWKGRNRYLAARGADKLIDADSLPDDKVNSWGVSDRALFEAALKWVDREPKKPFFLFCWTIETHHPYVVTGEPVEFGVDDPELNRYLNAVRQADANLAWLMEQLQQRGLADSTLVVVTGDHGELFGQHGKRVHNFDVYDLSVHVPLVLLHPALPGPRRRSEVRQQIDLAPTLLELSGAKIPKNWQGTSLLHPPKSPRAYFYALGNEALLGVREGTYTYQYHVGSGSEALFDLATDPGQLSNIAPNQPDRCAALRRRVNGLVHHQREFLRSEGAP